jgi:superkiller protein 3
MARRADPDPWREKLRSGIGHWNETYLKQLAGDKALRQQPAESVVLLARALVELGLREQAAAVLRAAWQDYPHDFWVNYDLAYTSYDPRYEFYERPEEAIRYLTSAIGIRPKSATAHNRLGKVLWHEGRFDEAMNAFRAAIRLKPELGDLHYNLGITLNARKEYAKAISEFNTALLHNPDLIEAYVELGNALSGLGKSVEAFEEYHKAVRLKNDSFSAHFALGEALLKQGNAAEALDEYQTAIKLRPGNAWALYRLESILRTLGQTGKAKAAHGQLLDAARASQFRFAKEDLDEVAYAWMGWGDFKDAAEVLDHLLGKYPSFCVANATLGEYLVMQCRFPDALRQLRTARNLYSKQTHWDLPTDYPEFIEQVVRLLAEHDEKFRKLALSIQKVGLEMTCLELAPLARQQGLHVMASLLYKAMFTVHTEFANDLAANRRFDAACAAVRASAGSGPDDLATNEQDRAGWRKQALEWLQDDLKTYKPRLKGRKRDDVALIRQRLQVWQTHDDLARVRDPVHLTQLLKLNQVTEAERLKWLALWQQVRALEKEARGN